MPTSAAQTPVTSTGRHRASEYTEAERRTAAIEVGRFLRHALEEEHQGASSRDRIKLQSRVYILCKNISGRLYNPVKIFHSFAAIKPLVKVDGECGNSVFVGLPTVWEAKVAVRAAGLNWPADE